MSTISPGAGASPTSLWAGRILSALVVLFMLFDTTIHLLKPQVVVEAFNRLGYSPDLSGRSRWWSCSAWSSARSRAAPRGAPSC